MSSLQMNAESAIKTKNKDLADMKVRSVLRTSLRTIGYLTWLMHTPSFTAVDSRTRG